jgi:xylose dehydrogenase (NAD/NADP)
VIRWGFLSTANINRKLLVGARLAEGAEVVAVASRSIARAEAWAREHAVDRAHGSYEALLADDEVDAVYISLPNSLHVEWSVRALEAGKHVLCEKPLAARAADAERAFDTAERAGRVLTEAFMYRHHPQAHRLRALVRDGAIGRLQAVRAVFSFPLVAGRKIRLDTALDGGALMDVGCHCVHGARMLAGEPERALAVSVPTAGGVDGFFTGTLGFPDGVVATFHCGLHLPRQDELEAIGDAGSAFLDDPWHCREPLIELRRDGGVECVETPAEDPYRCELDDLGAAIEGRAEPLLGRRDAVAQARAIEALRRAADRSQAVSL